MTASGKRLAAVWARWFEADYSWQGLLDPRKTPDGFASLQQFWLTDPQTGKERTVDELVSSGELIEAEGQPSFHLAHLPLRYPDGQPTRKASEPESVEERLTEVIVARLQASAAVAGDGRPPTPPAALDGAVFLELPLGWLEDMPVAATWRDCVFTEEASFQELHFHGDPGFYDAAFCKYVWFDEAVFDVEATFSNSVFLGTAQFDGAIFSAEARFASARFEGPAQFDSVTFADRADFAGACFRDRASFSATMFSGPASFREAVFRNAVDFGHAPFAGQASFVRAHFAGPMRFYLARFQHEAFFAELRWPDDPLNHGRAFDGAVFEELANFSNSGFCAFAAFAGARFENGIRFDSPPSERAGQQAFDRELAAIAAPSGGRSRAKPAASQSKSGASRPKPAARRDDLDARYRDLELGCRVLKQEMAGALENALARLLFSFELKARRMQRSTPGVERFLSAAYELTSDYGVSLWRPLAALLALWLLCAAIYGLYGLNPHPPPPVADQISGALTLSLSRLFPFGPFENVSDAFIASRHMSPLAALLCRAVETAQSVVALALVFLFALAVKRRFQIDG